jgi:hypothetical protein
MLATRDCRINSRLLYLDLVCESKLERALVVVHLPSPSDRQVLQHHDAASSQYTRLMRQPSLLPGYRTST